jgi:hypothetical protein
VRCCPEGAGGSARAPKASRDGKPTFLLRGYGCVGKTGNFRTQRELPLSAIECSISGTRGWLMKSPCERRSIRLGRSIWRRTATSMPRTAVDACWNVICGGGRKPAKAILKNSPVLGLLTLTGLPRTNGEANRAADQIDNCWKREARVDVTRPFLPVFGSAGLGGTIRSACRLGAGEPQPGSLLVDEFGDRSGDQCRRRDWEPGAFTVSLRSFR